MRFVKIEGAGNDYVLVEGPVAAPAELSRRVSDRHLGVGSDGLIILGPPAGGHHATMRMFNADGSEGRMCGNGLRCVVRWLIERRGAPRDGVSVLTAAGPRGGRMDGHGRVAVGMGVPSFLPADVPVRVPGDGRHPPVLDLARQLPGPAWAVSTGNPHVILRVDDVAACDLEAIGRELQDDARLPDSANVHLVQVEGAARLRVRPFERGSGATRACGTGAVGAVAVARRLAWISADEVTVSMPGDDLRVTWAGAGEAWLGGPSRLVFDGDWPEP